MIKSYLKTSLRNLWNNKFYGFLNLSGLSLGIACAALILLWIEDEVTYNHNFVHRDNIYRVMENQTYGGTVSTFIATPGPFGALAKVQVPGIRSVSRMSAVVRSLFSIEDKAIYQTGNYIDSTFFDMFSIHFIKGNARDALTHVNSLVVTETFAKNLFPSGDAIGKTVQVDKTTPYTITGVIEDMPKNTSFEFSWLAPYEVYEQKSPWIKEWDNNSIATFVELQEGVHSEDANLKIRNMLSDKQRQSDTKCFLFAMNDWRLRNSFENGRPAGGRITFVRLFMLIAIIILGMACINFMNLATARSEQRAMEVGIRKVLGVERRSLIFQFIGESLFLSGLAAIFAIGIIYLLLPWFNHLTQKDLSAQLLRPTHFGVILLVWLFTGLVAGLYPALYLSSFNAIHVLKGAKISDSLRAGFIRKGLVVIQFSIAIILIICTIVIYQQLSYVKDRELGYSKDNLIYMNLSGNMAKNYPVIKNDLESTGLVQNSALSYSNILEFESNGGDLTWQGKDPNDQILITQEDVSSGYIPTFGLKLLEGRNFYDNPDLDSSSVIINESLARMVAKQEVLSRTISRIGGRQYRIVGIIKDFIFNDIYNKPSPLILMCNPNSAQYLSMRLVPNKDMHRSLSSIEAVFKKDNPGYPFEFKFINAEFDSLFKYETLIGSLANTFSIIAIFISCLGLFGLTGFNTERRTKEIAIRKTLGASVFTLIRLLAMDFIKLILISCLLAFPLSWLIMHQWLENYAYRTQIYFWIFLLAFAAAIIIALITISFHTIKTVRLNPSSTLRSQ